MAAKKKAAKNPTTENRRLRKALREALEILKDNTVIDPFARRDAREILTEAL